MKKSFKALALGLAALGAVAGSGAVFAAAGTATTEHVDHLKVNINPLCTFGTITGGVYDNQTDQTTHEDGVQQNDQIEAGENVYGSATVPGGHWTNGANATVRNDTLAITMMPGTSNANIGKTNLTVLCTNDKGYTISAQATDLVKADTDKKIVAADGYGEGGVDTGESYWNIKINDISKEAAQNKANVTIAEGYNNTAKGAPTAESTILITKNAAGDLNGNDVFEITYGLGINKTQESGTYEGDITYTLAQLND